MENKIKVKINKFENALIDFVNNNGYEDQEGFKEQLIDITNKSDVIKSCAVKLFYLLTDDLKLTETEKLLLKSIKYKMEGKIDNINVGSRNNALFEKASSKVIKTREYYINYYQNNKDKYNKKTLNNEY